MARTKQTARKSTGGKAPRKIIQHDYNDDDEDNNNYNHNNNFASYNEGSEIEESTSNNNMGRQALTSSGYATSLADFQNPGENIESFIDDPFASFAAPKQTSSFGAQASHNFNDGFHSLSSTSSHSSASLNATFQSYAFSSAFVPKGLTRPGPTLLVLVARLFKSSRLSASERSHLKNEILKGSNLSQELERIYFAFQQSGDEHQALLSLRNFCGSDVGTGSQVSSGERKFVSDLFIIKKEGGPTLFQNTSHSHEQPKKALAQALLTIGRLAVQQKLSSSEKATLKDLLLDERAHQRAEILSVAGHSKRLDTDHIAQRLRAISDSAAFGTSASSSFSYDIPDGSFSSSAPSINYDFNFYIEPQESTPDPFYTPFSSSSSSATTSDSAWSGLQPATSNAEVAWTGKPLISDKQELVIFVGMPASGKSTFARKHFVPAGYVHVNRDTLKTQPACLKLTRSSLVLGKSVVVDNTSPSAEAREEYTQIAKGMGIPVRCFFFDTPEHLASQLNVLRENKEGVPRIPKMGYNMYRSKFERPSEDEGFSEVKHISFVPQFDSSADQALYSQYVN